VLLFLCLAGWAAGQDKPLDVFSGQALNDQVVKLRDAPAPVAADPEPHLEARLLEAITLTRLDGSGSGVSLLRRTRWTWPAALRGEEARKDRERWEKAMCQAAEQARKGRVADEVVRQLAEAYKSLLKGLADRVADMTPSEYIESRRFLNRLGEAVVVVRDPKVGEWLRVADDLATTRRSIPHLVRFLHEKKVRFGPCQPADGAAYLELHRAFADYAKRSGVGR
jgi:hypothetical protein